ncbi:ABC transporter ATP-binding protein [Halomonas aquamarina]|uniref:ABC transporter ATP-binding protein n=1 Tax=Vreelandella aquamarina TaxID=77097 RepID=A0ACC5VSP2_9GAMM|nr:ABC transporter ATP-binding protein [Halomonas aquamarina]MBZ5487097.1 ABC transporter ATP-binding protein [Halomonas aquamarina]
MCSDPVLSVRDLRIQIGRQAVVDGLSFDVMSGERICLLGASGSGKSFTANAVLGLLPPAATVQGSIRLHGREIIATPAARRINETRVAMVFQDSLSALNPLASIGSQLCEPFIRHHGLSRKKATAAAVALLEAMKLHDPERLVKRTPAELSGGQRQRVCIALAMACKTSLMVADEPTTALDVVTQAQVLRALREHTDAARTALLFITHDLHAAAQLCQRAVIIERGEMIESGPLDALITAPKHRFTRELVAAAHSVQPSLARPAEALPEYTPHDLLQSA